MNPTTQAKANELSELIAIKKRQLERAKAEHFMVGFDTGGSISGNSVIYINGDVKRIVQVLIVDQLTSEVQKLETEYAEL